MLVGTQATLTIEALVDRIVAAVHPLRIIVFGSAARGDMTADSDIDVMVVMPEGTHRLRTARFLYQQLLGFGCPLDIVVATPNVLEMQKDNIGLVYRSVLAEGKEVYAAQ
jgi:predicted nucleotidyltransferase